MNNNMKQFSLAARNFINSVTGQQSMIDQYNKITHTLTLASDKETDPQKKQEMIKAYQNLSEDEWIPLADGGFEIDGFNPYKPFQKGVLDTKIKTGNQLLAKFDLV